MEHPFYVFGQGWSSISPKDTMARYNLPCKDPNLGDLCISLTHKHAQRSSPHSLQHIKEETSSPPISQMPKLQPIDLNIDDRSCELIPSYNNYQRNFSGDSNDERKYPSPSSSRDSIVSPNAPRYSNFIKLRKSRYNQKTNFSIYSTFKIYNTYVDF